jgi:hypothetical protein
MGGSRKSCTRCGGQVEENRYQRCAECRTIVREADRALRLRRDTEDLARRHWGGMDAKLGRLEIDPQPAIDLRIALAQARAHGAEFREAWRACLPAVLDQIQDPAERNSWRLCLGELADAWHAAYLGASSLPGARIRVPELLSPALMSASERICDHQQPSVRLRADLIA